MVEWSAAAQLARLLFLVFPHCHAAAVERRVPAIHSSVEEIMNAVRDGTTWKLPGMIGHQFSVPKLWNDGLWKVPLVTTERCPQRVPGLHNLGSIRTRVRIVFSDNGHCLATGNLDAGVCVHVNGTSPVRCLPSFIIMGTGKGGTAELQGWLSHHPQLRRVGDIHSKAGGGELDYFGRELKTEKQLEATWRTYANSWMSQEGTQELSEQYTFEKSPGYLAHATHPKLMRLLLPSIKLASCSTHCLAWPTFLGGGSRVPLLL